VSRSVEQVVAALEPELSETRIRSLRAAAAAGSSVVRTVVERGWLHPNRVCERLAAHFRSEIVSLPPDPIPAQILALVPEEVAWGHLLLPVGVRQGGASDTVIVAAAEPPPTQVWTAVRACSSRPLAWALTPVTELVDRIRRAYRPGGPHPLELPVVPPEGPSPFPDPQIASGPVGLERTGVLVTEPADLHRQPGFDPRIDAPPTPAPVGTDDIPFSPSEVEARRMVPVAAPASSHDDGRDPVDRWLAGEGPASVDRAVLRALVQHLLDGGQWTRAHLRALLDSHAD
jgi:hypothetical protein